MNKCQYLVLLHRGAAEVARQDEDGLFPVRSRVGGAGAQLHLLPRLFLLLPVIHRRELHIEPQSYAVEITRPGQIIALFTEEHFIS